MKKILIVALCVLSVSSSMAQRKRTTRKAAPKKTATAAQPQQTALGTQTDDASKTSVATAKPFERPLDGYFKKTNILSAKVTPYPNLRENDVAFAKRIWREIDLREKMNQYLGSPKARLIDVLMNAVMAGELTAYDPTPTKDDPNGDSFSTPLKPGEAMAKFADSTVVDQFDPKTGDKIGSKMVAGEFNPDSVIKFRIKEDWVFDRQRSIFEPRIVGIAPMVKPKVGNGVETDYQPAFWIYFPDARQVLAVKEAMSRNSDATGLSFDDVFMKRIFASYIVKQSNDKDERIKDYAQGIDRLYESERIKKSLMDWELGLWSY
ncbi:type IX secretion system ring subunit PorN/GldN [Mucilaginibacter koreensis]